MKRNVKQFHHYQQNEERTLTSNNSLQSKIQYNKYGVASPGLAWHRHCNVAGLNPTLSALLIIEFTTAIYIISLL